MSDDVKCPKCGSTTRERWSRKGKRRLERVCYDLECEEESCHWVSEPYEPPEKQVETTRRIYLPGNGWTYEAFDGRGHIMTSSRTYETRAECFREAEEDVRRATDSGNYWGECRAVVWPPSVVVTGEVVRPKNRKKPNKNDKADES